MASAPARLSNAWTRRLPRSRDLHSITPARCRMRVGVPDPSRGQRAPLRPPKADGRRLPLTVVHTARTEGTAACSGHELPSLCPHLLQGCGHGSNLAAELVYGRIQASCYLSSLLRMTCLAHHLHLRPQHVLMIHLSHFGLV